MSGGSSDHSLAVAAIRGWAAHDAVRHSRLLWRLYVDERLDPPWPYRALWHDPAGAALLDLSDHPLYRPDNDDEPTPWLHLGARSPEVASRLLKARLPAACQLLLDQELVAVLDAFALLENQGLLQVRACEPGGLLGKPAACRAARLTVRDAALVADAGWRPEDLANEVDEAGGLQRWAVIERRQLSTRLLEQRIGPSMVEISDVFTDPTARRRGLAGSLVHHVTQRAHERGDTVTYSVHPSNFPSLRLAGGLGFTERFTWARVGVERLDL